MHIVNGCVKSSMHYRSQSRINSRVFIPDEYLPMQKERSLDGSGPLEPQDYQLVIPSPRLVRVDNVNIQFENEEARWMTKGCRDRLLKLVAHVQNAWPGNEVALRVTRSWQKPPAAYQTQRPATKAISNRSHPGLRHKQSAAPPPPAALFDWCFFSRDGYVHCSVKPDSIIVSQWFGCFPGAASAMRPNGSIVPLSQVKIGDTLLTYDLSKHAIQPTTVISFLHRDEHQFSTWINITFVMPSQHVSSLLLTGNHLIYRRLSRSSETDDATSVFAKAIVPGDFIICSTNPVKAFCKVLRVSEVNGTLAGGSIGVYAPLTSSGTLLVDGVLVSCYAHVRYEWLARLATLPLRIYYFLVSQMELANPSWPVEHGVHWFAELLLHFAKFILPETIFFN
nr:unnamed protein product [Spirometra erinaceieuropaei]